MRNIFGHLCFATDSNTANTSFVCSTNYTAKTILFIKQHNHIQHFCYGGSYSEPNVNLCLR